MNTFGDRLRITRNARGLTQDELAEMLGVSKSAVSAWENNNDAPAFDKLPKLRAKLGVSLDELVCPFSTKAAQANQVMDASPGYAVEAAETRDEIRLLRRFRAINERKRKALIVLLDAT